MGKGAYIPLLFIYTIATYTVRTEGNSPGPSVNISDGEVTGFTETVNGTEVHTFLGIPFAKPPVGILRFRRPEPVDPWQGALNATKQPPSCRQPRDDIMLGIVDNQSEDCLYLNVWRPSTTGNPAVKDVALKAVMVWIYGGGFTSGSIVHEEYNGKNLAASQDVIIVSMNYRLAVVGFLYLGKEEAPGNMGLMDQQLALKWVQTNIEAFGGNPERVTIFGESAGSWSVAYHLLSPGSRDLYKYAIMQSGAPLTNLFFDTDQAKAVNLALVQQLGCDRGAIEDVISCLEPIDALDMWYTYANSSTVRIFPVTVDGVFLLDSPDNMLEAGDYKSTNLLIGTTADEGSAFVWEAAPDLFPKTRPPTINRQQFLEFTGASADPIESLAVEFEYTVQNVYPGANYSKLTSDVYGDTFFVCPCVKYANHYAANGDSVYKYQLAQGLENSEWPEWFGVFHGVDVYYVFGYAPFPFTPEERKLSHRIQRYWASFAKTGVPDDGEGSDWPLYQETSFITNILDFEQAHVTYRLDTRKCKFWQEYLPALKAEFEKGQSSGCSGKEILHSMTFTALILTLTVW